MNTLRHVLTAIGIVALVGAGEYVTAGPQATPSWTGHARAAGGLAAGEFPHVLQALHLTADQQAQIKEIFSGQQTQLQVLRAGAMQNRQAMAVTAPTDPAYPVLLATEKADAAALIQEASDIKTQIYAVLTPAQQAQIPVILASDQAARATRWAQQQP